jgi:hypothetical protein
MQMHTFIHPFAHVYETVTQASPTSTVARAFQSLVSVVNNGVMDPKHKAYLHSIWKLMTGEDWEKLEAVKEELAPEPLSDAAVSAAAVDAAAAAVAPPNVAADADAQPAQQEAQAVAQATAAAAKSAAASAKAAAAKKAAKGAKK